MTDKKALNELFEAINNKMPQNTKLIKMAAGKQYEAKVLLKICRELYSNGFSLTLHDQTNGNYLTFRSGGGPIQKSKYAYIQVADPKDGVSYDIFTDIEFVSMSHYYRGRWKPLQTASLHELDIVCVTSDSRENYYPAFFELRFGVECKDYSDKSFSKGTYKEMLGVAREAGETDHGFHCDAKTPGNLLYGDKIARWPGFWLAMYSTAPYIKQFEKGQPSGFTGKAYGIHFEHYK